MRPVRLWDSMQYLGQAGKIARKHHGQLKELVLGDPFDPTATLRGLEDLQKRQTRAKVARPPITAQTRHQLDEAVSAATGLAQMARGYFRTKNLDYLLSIIPPLPKRTSFDARKRYVRRIEILVHRYPDLPGAKILQSKLEALSELWTAKNDARRVSKELTRELYAELMRAIDEAVAWMMIFRGLALLKRDAALKKSIPRLPLRRQRKGARRG